MAENKNSGGSSGGGGGGGGSCMTQIILGCGCFSVVLVLLVATFVLGSIYGREIFPSLFNRTHDVIERLNDQLNEAMDGQNQAPDRAH